MPPYLASVTTALALACLLPSSTGALAKVRIDVDLDMQVMHVEGKDKSFETRISSGRIGHETPTGEYKVLWMDKDHHSDEYDGAAMPNAIFFAPGFAIHGFAKSPWGHKASHGCVRVPVARSAELFDMVKAEGGAEISVRGVSDGVAPTVAQAEARTKARTGEASEGSDYRPMARYERRERTYGYPAYGYPDPYARYQRSQEYDGGPAYGSGYVYGAPPYGSY